MNVFAAAADVAIAAILCLLLHNSRTKFHKSNTLINKLASISALTEVFVGDNCLLATLDGVCGQHWPAHKVCEARRSGRILNFVLNRHTLSVCACISLITYFAAPLSFVYICFYFLMGRRASTSIYPPHS